MMESTGKDGCTKCKHDTLKAKLFITTDIMLETISHEPQTYTKRVWTASECAEYMGISLSTLYKMTHARTIPHYKPTGKMLYFNSAEIEAWLLSNRVRTDEELQAEALSFRKGGER